MSINLANLNKKPSRKVDFEEGKERLEIAGIKTPVLPFFDNTSDYCDKNKISRWFENFIVINTGSSYVAFGDYYVKEEDSSKKYHFNIEKNISDRDYPKKIGGHSLGELRAFRSQFKK